MPRLRYRKPSRAWKADDWPFYRNGVNPVAADTPEEVVILARAWLAVRRDLSPMAYAFEQQLTRALGGAGLRNKYHRAGDQLVGLFDRLSGHSELDVTPAFTRLY